MGQTGGPQGVGAHPRGGRLGAGIVALSLTHRLGAALAALAFAGAADMVSGLMRSTIWNQTIPDSLRGRLAGVEMLSYVTGPLLGNFEGGVAES